jgi:fructokinase
MDDSLRFGIDMGGTKTEIIALDAQTGVERYRRRVATVRSYEGVVRAIRDLVCGAEAELSARGTVGVGIPGTISRTSGLVKNANSTWIIGKPLDRDVSIALKREVRLENDANCFAVSEAKDGAGRGALVVFGVILGTGAGGGIVVNGKPLGGINGIGGEWGHNPLPSPRLLEDGRDERPGPACYCGRNGCIETWISGPGFEADFQAWSGEKCSSVEIAGAASRGDGAAKAALERYMDRLARGLAHIVNVLDPDVIVLGGGMSNIGSLYTEVPRIWGQYIFSDSVLTVLKPPVHGDSSGVRGAAWLWP